MSDRTRVLGIAHRQRSTGPFNRPPRSISKLKEQGGCFRHPSPSHRNRSTGGSFVKDRDELEVVWWTGWPETAPTNRSTKQPPALDQAALLNSTFGSDGDGRREQGFITRGRSDTILNRAFRGLDIGVNYSTTQNRERAVEQSEPHPQKRADVCPLWLLLAGARAFF